jgi:hypothetical protein
MDTIYRIDDLLERLRAIMPSNGVWPFTILRVNREDYKGLDLEAAPHAAQQLLVLIRTDFSRTDLLDYLINSKEFESIPFCRQEEYLNEQATKLKDPGLLLKWSENIAYMALGLAFHLSKSLNLCIDHLDTDLHALDAHFSFPARKLKSFRFFDIYTCK